MYKDHIILEVGASLSKAAEGFHLKINFLQVPKSAIFCSSQRGGYGGMAEWRHVYLGNCFKSGGIKENWIK